MDLSVIIPAFNEEKYLDATLRSISSALQDVSEAEVIVVDNQSTDQTRFVAERSGARVVGEDEHNISRVRNAGGHSARGDVLVFIDADTIVPRGLFNKITSVMQDGKCAGGSVAVEYDRFERPWVRYYLMGWLFWGRVLKMRHGAAQFCRRSVFQELNGYDESLFMGEDIDFQWRLQKYARASGGYDGFIEEPKVKTSARRFSKMGLIRTLFLTHPITILLARRIAWPWKDWYENAVR